MRLFYAGILMKKLLSTLPRICFETPIDSVNRMRGISQAHWFTLFSKLFDQSDSLNEEYKVMKSRLDEDGVLPDTVQLPGEENYIRPISAWRSAVRSFIDTRELQRFDQATRIHSTFGLF